LLAGRNVGCMLEEEYCLETESVKMVETGELTRQVSGSTMGLQCRVGRFMQRMFSGQVPTRLPASLGAICPESGGGGKFCAICTLGRCTRS
jgi:hypothetical protein